MLKLYIKAVMVLLSLVGLGLLMYSPLIITIYLFPDSPEAGLCGVVGSVLNGIIILYGIIED